ncbi:MAG: hypothetical protein EPN41_07795 [Candidimonas sp.]|nr:MAG: hypothetical protein EPN41_07795 [Candidimonas sp.]
MPAAVAGATLVTLFTGFPMSLRPLLVGLAAIALLGSGAAIALWGAQHSPALRSLIGPALAEEPPTTTTPAKAPGKPATEKQATAPIFVSLDPFTVTLDDDGSTHILYTAITVQVNDERSAAAFKRYMPAVRNRVLMVLAGEKPAGVTTPASMDTIKAQVRQALIPPFQKGDERQDIRDVLFTAFVVQ